MHLSSMANIHSFKERLRESALDNLMCIFFLWVTPCNRERFRNFILTNCWRNQCYLKQKTWSYVPQCVMRTSTTHKSHLTIKSYHVSDIELKKCKNKLNIRIDYIIFINSQAFTLRNDSQCYLVQELRNRVAFLLYFSQFLWYFPEIVHFTLCTFMFTKK